MYKPEILKYSSNLIIGYLARRKVYDDKMNMEYPRGYLKATHEEYIKPGRWFGDGECSYYINSESKNDHYVIGINERMVND